MKKLITIILISLTSIVYSQEIDFTEIELNFIGDSNPKNLTKGITKIYFSADDEINGNELWVYDVITNTTYMVKNIGFGDSNGIDNSRFFTIGDILYFTPNNYTYGSELWRSDGTESGTYLLKDISNTTVNTIENMTNFNGNLVFTVNDNINGNEVWISDGTAAGTVILKDIYQGSLGSNPANFIVFNNHLFFTATNNIYGNEIWKSDGTTLGTVILKDIVPNNLGGILGGNMLKFDNAFYFYAYSTENGFELWRSDGTETGTQLFKDLIIGNIGSNNNLIGTVTANYFVFEVNSPLGVELWKCDGTQEGTMLIKDINPSSGSSVSEFTQFAVFNDKVYFDAYTVANGTELWVTDGTESGTVLVKDIFPGNENSNIFKLTATSNYLIFSASNGSYSYNTLWKSDGTTSGTLELKNLNLTQFSNTQFNLIEFNNLVFFPAGYNTLHGIELYTTDGTIANTIIFKEINHNIGGMSDFYDSAELGDKLIFTGNNGNSDEPFVSDGTINGTHMIKNINPGGNSIFTSSNFRSASYTKAGNYVFFRATNSVNGFEIWKTDGTEANTSLVKDIWPGGESSITESILFMEYNGIFYFKANDGIHGEELWRSDGTLDGTYMLKDINVGSGHAFGDQSNIYYNSLSTLNEKCYAVLNGYLYFAANDGIDSSIWRTDGTEAGTQKVIVIPESGVYDNRRVVINATSDKIFFKSNSINSSNGNNTLWSSDGTQEGTTLLGTWILSTTQFKKNIIHNDEIYFAVNSNLNGRTLMKSDGTVIGTQIVKDNFTDYETFTALTSCGNYVYFSTGYQGSSGKNLWRTDGTTVGTTLLGEIPLSTPENFIGCTACIQNNLLFIKNSLNNNKLYYVNGNSTNSNDFLTINIINSENFGVNDNYFVSGFYEFNNELYMSAGKQKTGSELYFTDFDFTLTNDDFINNTIQNNIVVYPNPAKNTFSIKVINNEEINTIHIYDLLGKEMYLSYSNQPEFNISNLHSGIYIIKVYTDKTNYSSKLVINK